MADPLSSATRATKRNLLVASVLAISANAFNVTVEKIPVGGLSINFDSRLFAFLLLVVLLYFFCTFAVYYTIDIKNAEKTTHQTKSEELYERRVLAFSENFKTNAANSLHRELGPEHSILINESFANRKLNPTDKGFYRIHRHRPERSFDPYTPVERTQEPELYSKLDPLITRWHARYPRAAALDQWRAGFMVGLVRSTYFIRNYILDGALPIALGCIAILATFGLIDLAWIQKWLPHTKTISMIGGSKGQL